MRSAAIRAYLTATKATNVPKSKSVPLEEAKRRRTDAAKFTQRFVEVNLWDVNALKTKGVASPALDHQVAKEHAAQVGKVGDVGTGVG